MDWKRPASLPALSMEQYAVGLVGTASVLYIMRCAPLLVVPWGVVNALGWLASGMFLSLLALGAAVVGAWLFISEPYSPNERDIRGISGAGPSQGEQNQAGTSLQQSGPSTPHPYGHGGASDISRESPPPNVSQGGEFSDWVYTVPTEMHDVTEALVSWPPVTEGNKAVATRWHADAMNGQLRLTPAPVGEKSSSNDKSSSHEATAAAVTIPLAGCCISVPEDALRGKSKWWRKCPLLVEHPDRALLRGKRSFYMFASTAFAKAQWHDVLQWGSSGGGGGRVVQDLFRQWSLNVRKSSGVPQLLPQAVPLNSPAATGSGKSHAHGRWCVLKSAVALRNAGRTLSRRHRSGKSTNALASLAAVNSDDSDAVRHLSDNSAAGLLQSARRGHSDPGRSLLPGAAGAPGQADGTGQEATPSSLHPLSIQGSSADGSFGRRGQEGDEPPTPSFGTASRNSSSTSRSGTAISFGSLASQGRDSGSFTSELSSPAPRLLLEPLSRVASAPIPPAFLPGTKQESSGVPPKASGSTAPAATGPGAGAGGGGEPPEAAANMLLARLFFDLLRAPSFEASTAAYVQRKLDQLSLPPFMGPLQVVDVSVGQTVPEVSHFRSLPSPTSDIWPQFMMDFCYRGDAWVMIETSIDLRGSTAWMQFDGALGQLAGDPASTPPRHTPAAPSAAPSSDGDSDPGSDGSGRGSSHPEPAVARKLLDIGPLKASAAGRIRKYANSAAKHISRIPLRLKVRLMEMEGTMLMWVPPPPGDRMWTSFTDLRCLDLTAKPVVAGRMLKSTTQALRASQWMQTKLKRSITRNLVFPACSDVRLSSLIPWGHPDMERPLPQPKSGVGAGERILEADEPGRRARLAAGFRAVRPLDHHTELSTTAEVGEDSGAGSPPSAPATSSPGGPAPPQGGALHSLADVALAAAAAHRAQGDSGGPARPPKVESRQLSDARSISGRGSSPLGPHHSLSRSLSPAPSGRLNGRAPLAADVDARADESLAPMQRAASAADVTAHSSSHRWRSSRSVTERTSEARGKWEDFVSRNRHRAHEMADSAAHSFRRDISLRVPDDFVRS